MTRPRLEWEKHRWAVEIVQRVAIATVKAAAWEATRRPNERLPGLRCGARLDVAAAVAACATA